MKTMFAHSLTVLTFAVVLLAGGPSSASRPVPLYNANVTKFTRLGDGSVVIATKDSVTRVCAWYRKNLQDQNGESTTKDGAHLFYTHNGATVSVEPGNRFAPETTIGLVWDAKKFGPYTGK